MLFIAHPRFLIVRLAAAVLLAFAAKGLAQAQTARWHPDRGTLGVGQSAEIQLIIEGGNPDGAPTLPALSGLTLDFAGSTSSTQMINFKVTHSLILTYLARAHQRGRVRIPAFDLKTDKGTIRVPPAEYEVGDATVGQSGTPLDSIVQSRFTLPQGEVWAGEVFPLTYTLSIARRVASQPIPNIDWSPAPLMVEEWSKPEPSESTVAGEPRSNTHHRTRALARNPGTIALKPAQQLVNIQTGSAPFGFFARPTVEQFAITTPPATVTVKPLPPQAPADFSGAVGQFTFVSKVVPTTVSVGEPITWTLELTGTGNWPDLSSLPAREVSRDFRVVQPQAKRTAKDNLLFDATLSEDVVLIPTKPGTYTLGPVRWSYFDPKSGQYRTVDTEKFTITVTAPVVAPAPPPPSPDPAKDIAAKSDETPTPATLPDSPPLPGLIPRDPLSGEANVLAPLDTLPITVGAASSALGILALWAGLALRRARFTDPLRARREAHARLAETLLSVQDARDLPRQRQHLQAWQRDSLVVLGLPRATPTLEKLASHTRKNPSDPTPWPDLWRDADRTLYAANSPLPSDWVERARSALHAQALPKFTAVTLFRPRNLLPLLALAIALSTAIHASAADGSADYRKGEFESAEKIWRARVASVPTDWIARHNLSLALSQQDRWGEAAAESTAAFVQQPNDSDVRWQLTLALQRAGYAPAEIVPFLNLHPAHRVAQTLSPTHWKLTVIIAAWLFAGAIGLALVNGYSASPRWLRRSVFPMGGAGVILAALSLFSVRAYGTMSDRRAGVVWRPSVLRSIPTEADTTQKTTPLAAGSTARIEKSFLGWRRIAFTNGQTGWVPAKDLVPLWKSP